MLREAGPPAPTTSLEVPLGGDRDFTRSVDDALCSLGPQIEQLNGAVDKLGDFHDLPLRLQSEVEGEDTVVGLPGIIGKLQEKTVEECHRPYVVQSEVNRSWRVPDLGREVWVD
jgi:hypothetical protein